MFLRTLQLSRLASSFSIRRFVHTNKSKTSETSSQTPLISNINCDVIGPPNQISNLRPVLCHVPKEESEVELKYRLEREKVQRWNENFWIEHNSSFLKESNEFRKRRLETLSDKEKKTLSAEEMSEFYKAFLDRNWKMHVSYNFEWYCKNFKLLMLAFQVQLLKLKSGK